MTSSRPTLLRIALLLICAFAGNPTISVAIPDWWPLSPSEAQESARQTGRNMVLYFETEKAVDCIRMEEESWPRFEGTKAKDFIFLRLAPATHGPFFEFYDVFQTPEIVITDSTGDKELGRVKGYVEPDILLGMLGTIERGESNMVILPNGESITVSEYQSGQENRRKNEAKDVHFFYESFDKYASILNLSPSVISILVDYFKSIRVEPGGGIYSTPALYVGADVKSNTGFNQKPSAAVRFDVSRGLDQVNLIEGRLRVTMRLRALEMPENAVDCVAAVVVDLGAKAPAYTDLHRAEKVYTQTLFNRQTGWTVKEIITDTINFRKQKVYLIFWVDVVGQGFYVDDIAVDLIPPEGEGVVTPSVMEDMPDPLKFLKPTAQVSPIFSRLDVNQDGRIQPSELSAEERKALEKFLKIRWEDLDKNHDDILDLSEFPTFSRK